jgi:hypothetical protein
MLKSYDARLMRSYPVGKSINQAANDDVEWAKPVELKPSARDQLFV